MELDDKIIPALTLREAVIRAMDEDWNLRKKLVFLKKGEVLHYSQTVAFNGTLTYEHVQELMERLALTGMKP